MMSSFMKDKSGEYEDEKYEKSEEDLKFDEFNARNIGVWEWKVLFTLSYDGPQSMYAISKKNGKAPTVYPVVHRTTKDLEKIGWIRVAETRRSEKNVAVKIYTLTSEGLLWIFSKVPRRIPSVLIDPSEEDKYGLRRKLEEVESAEPEDLSTRVGVNLHLLGFDVDRIASANAKLFPLLFKNWDVLKKTDVAGDLSILFPDAAFLALWEYYHDFRGLRTKFGSLERLFVYESYRALLEKLGKICVHQEPEVKERCLNEILTLYENSPQLGDMLDILVSELQEGLKENLALLTEVKTAQTARAQTTKTRPDTR